MKNTAKIVLVRVYPSLSMTGGINYKYQITMLINLVTVRLSNRTVDIGAMVTEDEAHEMLQLAEVTIIGE